MKALKIFVTLAFAAAVLSACVVENMNAYSYPPQSYENTIVRMPPPGWTMAEWYSFRRAHRHYRFYYRGYYYTDRPFVYNEVQVDYYYYHHLDPVPVCPSYGPHRVYSTYSADNTVIVGRSNAIPVNEGVIVQSSGPVATVSAGPEVSESHHDSIFRFKKHKRNKQEPVATVSASPSPQQVDPQAAPSNNAVIAIPSNSGNPVPLPPAGAGPTATVGQ
jgi:hypothetical protein